jgi:hypothetical protein
MSLSLRHSDKQTGVQMLVVRIVRKFPAMRDNKGRLDHGIGDFDINSHPPRISKPKTN